MAEKKEPIVIAAPQFQWLKVKIIGTSPYVQDRLSPRIISEIRATQEAGSQARSKKKREAKDFKRIYQEAIHSSSDGWHGIPVNAFRHGMVSACRLCGFHMTVAKLAVFVEPDGFEKDTHKPLVKITKGSPKYFESDGRSGDKLDVRARPMYDPGWEAVLTIRFDSAVFSASDVLNLLHRVGQQIGIGNGRYDSPKSGGIGMGWGCFKCDSEPK